MRHSFIFSFSSSLSLARLGLHLLLGLEWAFYFSALGRVYHLKLSTWVGNFKELGSVPIFECLFDIIRSNDRSVADEEERSEYLPHLGGERNKFTIFPFCVSPHLKRIFLPYANMKSVMISTMILMTIMQFPMGMMLQQILKTENKKLHCFGQTMK
jgi:hypothetical protein